MADSRAEITATVLQILQDAGAATYILAETASGVREGLKELARYDPHLVDVIFKIESRKGAATSTLSPKLVDTAKDQFVAGDATGEKVVHNTTDNTWAVVKTYTDAENLVLTSHIMASGEKYEIYNKRCRNSKQIFIGDVDDYLEVDSVEYPVGTKRNFTVDGEVLEIDVDTVKDSDLTATTLPDIDVLVRFAKPHRLCQLTDLLGAVHTAANPTGLTMKVKSFKDGEVVEIGDEFHIADHRATYTIKVAVTLANQGSTGSIFNFYPALEATADADASIIPTKSTLKPQHEEILCNLVAARIAISKGTKFLQQLEVAITTLTSVDGAINTMMSEIQQAGNDLEAGRTAVALTPAIITKAEEAIGLIQNQISPAIAQFHIGKDLINLINKGGAGTSVPNAYANSATASLNNASAYANQAMVNLRQATGDESILRSYAALATADLSKAGAQLSQAGGFLSEITGRLNVASSSRLYRDWGERKLIEARTELGTLKKAKVKRRYPSD